MSSFKINYPLDSSYYNRTSLVLRYPLPAVVGTETPAEDFDFVWLKREEGTPALRMLTMNAVIHPRLLTKLGIQRTFFQLRSSFIISLVSDSKF